MYGSFSNRAMTKQLRITPSWKGMACVMGLTCILQMVSKDCDMSARKCLQILLIF